MGLTAVFFDLDNTLIDYAGYKLRTATAAAEELVRRGFPDTVENIIIKIYDVYKKHGMEYQKTMHDVIVQYGLEVNRAEMFQQAALIAYNRSKFGSAGEDDHVNIRPYSGTGKTIRKLKRQGLDLAIVSDGLRNKAWQRLLLAGLEGKFDIVVTRDDTGEMKPHRAPFELALERLKAKPHNVLMVGDSIDGDMYGAQQLGIRTCHAIYGQKDRVDGEAKGGMVRVDRRAVLVKPDFVINELRKLPPLTAELRRLK